MRRSLLASVCLAVSPGASFFLSFFSARLTVIPPKEHSLRRNKSLSCQPVNDHVFLGCAANSSVWGLGGLVCRQVLKLKGIPPLVALLRNPSAQVHQTASAALRNLSFKNNNSKEQIDRCGGIAEAVALLRDADSAETQKQLTGARLALGRQQAVATCQTGGGGGGGMCTFVIIMNLILKSS